ncbi:unnamed protein product, partial [Leptidea sinapis]
MDLPNEENKTTDEPTENKQNSPTNSRLRLSIIPPERERILSAINKSRLILHRHKDPLKVDDQEHIKIHERDSDKIQNVQSSKIGLSENNCEQNLLMTKPVIAKSETTHIALNEECLSQHPGTEQSENNSDKRETLSETHEVYDDIGDNIEESINIFRLDPTPKAQSL